MKNLVFAGLVLILATTGLASRADAMSEAQLRQLYLGVVEDAVAAFEPLWVDDSERIPNSGFFDFRRYDSWAGYPGYVGVITIAGNGMVTFCYAVLLTETDKDYFTEQRIPRPVILDHAIKSIRWCCLTSVYVENPYPYICEDTSKAFLDGKYWRRRFGYTADEVGWLTLAAAKLWALLDEETKRLVEEVMVGAAAKERLVRIWMSCQGGHHDQVKQDLACTMGAAFMFPHRPNAQLYLDAIRGNGIDMVSTLQDKARETKADGKAIKEWSRGWNLYQDYSSDHHGWSQMWYGSDMIFEGRLYIEILSRITGVPIPETFTYEGNGFDGVAEWVKRLFLPEGEPASVHGMEYDSYYGSGLLAYCYGAVLKKDPVAAALEERAAALLQRHSRAIQKYDYHRNSWAKAAMAYLVHKHADRARPLSLAEAWQRLEGSFHHRWQQNLIHRCRNKFASFSWGTISSYGRPQGGGVCGFVVPNQLHTVEPEPLVYLHPQSLVGEVEVTGEKGKTRRGPYPADQYRFYRDDGGFHCAGAVPTLPVEQLCAFFSFNQGPCVFFNTFRALDACRINWSGVATYFYVREGLTSSRNYYDAQGQQPLEQKQKRRSVWWCVDDVLGMATFGGNEQIEIARSVGRNWARTDAYKDKCDGVFVSPIRGRQLQAGENCGDVAIAIYTNTPHKLLSQVSRQIRQQSLDLPEGWKGLVVPDGLSQGKRYLALANLQGQRTQTMLNLTFAEGAPAISSEAVISGRTGLVPVRLARLESLAETLELYIECMDGRAVRARKETASRYVIRPLNEGKVKVRVRYRGMGAEEVVLSTLTGQADRLPIARFLEKEGVVLEVETAIRLELVGQAYHDHTAPAVEIGDVTIRTDGRVTVCVEAQDKSGIKGVVLYCDGKPMAEKSSAPYLWNCRPKSGYHSFYAVARDRSSNNNKRKSFMRTICVP